MTDNASRAKPIESEYEHMQFFAVDIVMKLIDRYIVMLTFVKAEKKEERNPMARKDMLARNAQ